MGKQKEILIVEDESDIRELMSFHLSKDNFFIDTASDGRIAYDKLLKNQYDLVIVDWMVPEISGLYLISWMRKPDHLQHKTPILMVTAKSDPANIILGLETGADDYMVKPFDFDVLRARVQNLLKRGDFLKSTEQKEQEQGVLSMEELALNKKSHQVTLRGKPLTLTYSEFRLLEILISNRGRVLSREQITSHIQGEEIIVTGRTIDTHISSLRKKLGEYGESIQTVRGVGYRLSFQ